MLFPTQFASERIDTGRLSTIVVVRERGWEIPWLVWVTALPLFLAGWVLAQLLLKEILLRVFPHSRDTLPFRFVR